MHFSSTNSIWLHDFYMDHQYISLQNSLQLKDLLDKQASLERELELRTEEVDYPSSQPQNAYEREVLLNIIEQLCMVMQKPLGLDIS